MATINDYFNNAQLAQASYAELNSNMDIPTYWKALKQERMAEDQYKQFASRYAIIDQQPNTNTGFSATLFWDWEQAKYTLAMRGTEMPGDIINDVALADIADIGGKGIAARQGVDLFNYYQRLITPDDETALQLELVIENSITAPEGVSYVMLDAGTGSVPIPKYMYLQTATSVTGFGLLSSGEQLNIAGHSLGGQLAMIMGRMFPGSVNEVYTYNAPGFDTALSSSETEWFFNAIADAQIRETGGSTVDRFNFPETKFNNFVILDDLISDIGTVPGGQTPHYGEGDNGYSAHLISGVTDAFAVYNLLATLQPTLTLDDLTPILQGADYYDPSLLESWFGSSTNMSLENIVNGIGDLFVEGEKVNPGNRDQMYTRIAVLQADGSVYSQYAGSLSVVAMNSASLAMAKSDTGYRYAIHNLNSFAITGDDAIYDSYVFELGLYDPATKTGNLTDAYLTDKSYFLNQLVAYNKRDDIDGAPAGNTTEYFKDFKTKKSMNAGLLSMLTGDRFASRYIFGDKGGNEIAGGDGADKLYGGGGNDVLKGTQYVGDDGTIYTLTGGHKVKRFLPQRTQRTQRKHLDGVFSGFSERQYIDAA